MVFRAITISGEVCSGKSSIANALISLLPGWKLVNIGQRFRDFCFSKGMSIQLVSTIDDETHMAFDKVQKDLLERERNIVAEGRLAGWLARDLEDVFRTYPEINPRMISAEAM